MGTSGVALVTLSVQLRHVKNNSLVEISFVSFLTELEAFIPCSSSMARDPCNSSSLGWTNLWKVDGILDADWVMCQTN
jgi:hypothetical protein